MGNRVGIKEADKLPAPEPAEAAGLDLNRLRADFERLGEDIANLRQHLAAIGGSGLRSVRETGAMQLEALQRELDELSADMQRRGRDAMTQIEQTVKEKPLTSLLVAFGAGMILARLFGRER